MFVPLFSQNVSQAGPATVSSLVHHDDDDDDDTIQQRSPLSMSWDTQNVLNVRCIQAVCQMAHDNAADNGTHCPRSLQNSREHQVLFPCSIDLSQSGFTNTVLPEVSASHVAVVSSRAPAVEKSNTPSALLSEHSEVHKNSPKQPAPKLCTPIFQSPRVLGCRSPTHTEKPRHV